MADGSPPWGQVRTDWDLRACQAGSPALPLAPTVTASATSSPNLSLGLLFQAQEGETL